MAKIKFQGSFLPRLISRSAKRRQWRRILREAGVEYAAPYAARHTVGRRRLCKTIDFLYAVGDNQPLLDMIPVMYVIDPRPSQPASQP